MKLLNPNWFSEGLMDAEYKRYVLLAYLQEIEKEYKFSKIFPALQNIAQNLDAMTSFRDECQSLASQFPKTISGFDIETGNYTYSSDVENPELFSVVEEIIEFSLPMLEEKLLEGQQIYDFVENLIEIEPLGVLPIYKEEGYLFVQVQNDTATEIYSYRMSFLEQGKAHRVLQTTLLQRVKRSLSSTYLGIKERLIKDFSYLPNPATYLVTSHLDLPKESTLLPVTKRLFTRQLATGVL